MPELIERISRDGFIKGTNIGNFTATDADIEHQKYVQQRERSQRTARNNLKRKVMSSDFFKHPLPSFMTNKDLLALGFPGGKNAVHTLFSNKYLIKYRRNGQWGVWRKNLIDFFQD